MLFVSVTPTIPSPETPPGKRFRGARLACAALVLALCVLAGWVYGRRDRDGRTSELFRETGTIIIAMQKIGQLHTASYQMTDVLQEDTQTEPSDWLKDVPGVEDVTHWATHNRALVTAEGTVEAGVDLSHLSEKDVEHIRRPDGSVRLRVYLPPITLYPPNVRVQVQAHDTGLFWRDDNIVPKAQEEAARRFRETAEKRHIREKARAGAIETLRKLTQSLHASDVEFLFR